MAINPPALFVPAAPVTGVKTNKEPTLNWVNVGYDVVDDETGEVKFVSLRMGIALDSLQPKPSNSSNESYREFEAARDYLLAQLKDAATKLTPGQAIDLPLKVQLRRVSDAKEQAAPGENRWVKPIFG